MSQDTIYNLDDYATLDLVEADTGEATPVAGIQDVTIIPSWTMERLYTADSGKIADQFQHEAAVQVDIGYSFFDGEVVSQWLGGEGASATSLTDTSDPQKYEITGTFEARDGSQQIETTVTGITFEEMPIFDAARGEYAQWDLSGEGEDVSNFEVTSPA